ncbi:enoyl-CoA hydratase/isomerase family protein [Pseudomonas sp. UL073]|uniref:Enoyl-CoA hydratase/isomerase family protein n=1 Tax=Zestomonas insulae TaxID=2809017 RepID=A0ABS2IIY5_9GAMM|nr:enoyl-CoA hydratase/isomerase family protein [Pseudomonas insulae]MBM7063025.1 enoyl-CoA hydratase/isomerase family protein [Pseudomonas insulae]
MSTELIQLREAQLCIDNGIAEFSHQKPSARNALSLELREDYAEMLDRVEADRSIRALILTGSGGSFCAGGDLKSLKARQTSQDPEDNSPDAMRRRLRKLHGWLQRLRDLELPVIAAVDGPAYGAGFALALTADFVLASSRATFCMSFAKVGLVPDSGVLATLPRVVGMAMAKELLFTARRVEVAEAKALGIVHAVHAPEALAEQARLFARRFHDAPREVLAFTKSLLNKSFETPYATLTELECQAQGVVSVTPYHLEAVRRFLAGEPSLLDWDRG